jgi:hypothetical protein
MLQPRARPRIDQEPLDVPGSIATTPEAQCGLGDLHFAQVNFTLGHLPRVEMDLEPRNAQSRERPTVDLLPQDRLMKHHFADERSELDAAGYELRITQVFDGVFPDHPGGCRAVGHIRIHVPQPAGGNRGAQDQEPEQELHQASAHAHRNRTSVSVAIAAFVARGAAIYPGAHQPDGDFRHQVQKVNQPNAAKASAGISPGMRYRIELAKKRWTAEK